MSIKQHKLGIIGWPVGHTLSPTIHSHWLAHHNLAGSYDRYAVDPSQLELFVDTLGDKNLTGFNVTLPHKETILPYLDSLDDIARRAGAVNTVTIMPDGTRHGHNTDVHGFRHNIHVSCPDLRLAGARVLILGAGGAARGAILGLLHEMPQQIILCNRTVNKAQTLQQEFHVDSIDWSSLPEMLPHIDLLVNTTSLGMKGQPDLVLDLTPLPPTAVVYDIVYTPLDTALLRQARTRGLRTIDGLGMLLYQAQRAFELWTGICPEVTQTLRSLCQDIIRTPSP